jgi:hypothetical protein
LTGSLNPEEMITGLNVERPIFRRIRRVAACGWMWPDGRSSWGNRGWLSPDVPQRLSTLAPRLAPQPRDQAVAAVEAAKERLPLP